MKLLPSVTLSPTSTLAPMSTAAHPVTVLALKILTFNWSVSFLFDFHFPSVWQSSPCKSHNGSIHPLCFHSSISFLCESVIMTKTMQWFFGSWSNCPLTVSALVITVDGSFLTLAIVAGTVGALEIGKRVDTATLVPPWQYRRCHCLHPQSRVRRRTRTRRQRRRRRRRWQAWSLLLSQPLFGPF